MDGTTRTWAAALAAVVGLGAALALAPAPADDAVGVSAPLAPSAETTDRGSGGLTLPALVTPAQTSGTILLPTPGVSRTQRCASAAGEAGNGIVGWTVFEVTPGAAFTLTATDSNAALQDLDIIFHVLLASCEENSVTTDDEHSNVAGDEAGTVPEDAGAAIIWLEAGANAGFTYEETTGG